MHAWLIEILDGLWALDGRAPRTFHRLLLRPGQLTLDDWSGRRARHLSPLRVYLTSSFVLFLILGLLSQTTHQTGFQGGLVQVSLPQQSQEIPEVDWQTVLDQSGPFLDLLIEQIARPALEQPDQIHRLLDRLPWFFFALVPMFALELRLLFWREDVRFVEHLVFSLHVHSVAFLLITFENLLRSVLSGPLSSFLLGATVALVNITLLAAALRRVYGVGRWGTFVRTVALFTLHGLVLSTALLVGIWWSLHIV